MASGVYRCLLSIGDVISENKEYLTDLDREIGDADHGVNLARGFEAIAAKVPADERDIGAALKKAGMALISTVGGASGPLYGTAFLDAGKKMAGVRELDAKGLKDILEAAISGIQRRGKAVRGEKTMVDAIIPAFETYCARLEEGDAMVSALTAACASAREGVEYTKTIRATKGRASYLGDRSIGHQDPGATSATLMLEALCAHLEG